jgi:IgA Peptidase M64
VASTHAAVGELVLHELGHSLGLLADEYGGPAPPACDAAVEPPEANVTKDLIKWTSWIDSGTPIPTFMTAPGVPGLYHGAKYCDYNLFRPTYNSKMRSLGVPFEQINREQLVKRIYNWVLPIDQWSPAATTVRLMRGQSQTFAVATPLPRSHALSVTWLLDGQPQSTAAAFTLKTLSLTPGLHRLEVIVADPTPMVRYDPTHLLRAHRLWTVEVVGWLPRR